ncbi:RecX family transcriptional regulator [Paenibacillus sp. TRM 82003]|nr:RecX family transcriptional regulator [Paenibacillus sp. TRM 82003]
MEGQGLITSVELQKRQKHRYNVFVDEQFALAVHEDVLMKHRLFKGERIDAARLQEVLKDEERQDAYVRAIRWLGARPRTEKEVRMYLKRREYEDEVIDECVKRLAEQRYIDDERFSHALAEERLKLQGKGKQWIKQELLQKGVDKGTVQETIGSLDPEDETEAAVKLARKRWRSLAKEEDSAAARRKLYGYLARRGYSASAVRAAVNAAAEDEGATEETDEWTWE